MGIATRGHQVEGEKNQTAEEINVGVFFSRQRCIFPSRFKPFDSHVQGSFTTQRFAEGLTWLVFTGQVQIVNSMSVLIDLYRSGCSTASVVLQPPLLPRSSCDISHTQLNVRLLCAGVLLAVGQGACVS